MLAFVDLEERVTHDHPIWTVKTLADEAVERLSSEFDRMHAQVGRASVPPERLLKASLSPVSSRCPTSTKVHRAIRKARHRCHLLLHTLAVESHPMTALWGWRRRASASLYRGP